MLDLNRNLANAAVTVALGIWVLVLAASKGRHFIADQAAAKTSSRTRVVPDWQKLTSGRLPVLGAPTASFKIIEFSDYQCPFCGVVDPIIATFVSKHPKDVVVYRYDMPLQQIHRYAYAAAVAANCAESQGVGEPYQSLLFQHQKDFAGLDWNALAKQSGVRDAEAFAQCIRSDAPHSHIYGDIKKGQALGISGTPTFIINGQLLGEPLTDSALESLYRDSHKQHGNLLDRLWNL